MIKPVFYCVLLSLAACIARADDFENRKANNWHQWRGPEATGVAPHGNPPTEWSETKNIKWKVEIPGRGSSSPIIWGDRIFILTAIKTDRTAEKTEETASTRQPSEFRLVSQPTLLAQRDEQSEKGERPARWRPPARRRAARPRRIWSWRPLWRPGAHELPPIHRALPGSQNG